MLAVPIHTVFTNHEQQTWWANWLPQLANINIAMIIVYHG